MKAPAVLLPLDPAILLLVVSIPFMGNRFFVITETATKTIKDGRKANVSQDRSMLETDGSQH